MKNLIQPFMTVIEKVARLISDTCKVNVVFQGTSACTDGKTIYLPALTDFSEETTKDTHGLVDHETGHILFTDFTQMPKVAKGRGEAFSRLLLNWLEDPREEACMIRKFPGTALNLKPFNDKYRPKVLADWASKPWPMRLIIALNGLYEGGETPKDEEIEGITQYLTAEIAAAKAATDTNGIRLACEAIRAKILKLLEEEMNKDREPEEGEGEGEGTGGSGGAPSWKDPKESKSKGTSKGKGSAKGKGEGEGEEGEGGEGSGKGKDGKAGEGEGEGATVKRGKKNGGSKAKASTVLKADRNKDEDDLFGEMADWSKFETATPAELAAETVKQEAESLLKSANKAGKHVIFTTKNDQVIDFTGKGDVNAYNKLRQEIRNATLSIRDTLERHLKVIENARWVGDRVRGLVNTSALRNLATNKAYRTPFKEMRRTETNNVAVSILIDQSGSMSENNKINVAQKTAVALAEALKELNVPFEVVGWYSQGDYENDAAWRAAGCPKGYDRTGERLNKFVYKAFEATDCSGITRLTCAGHNPDGEAVRWAAGRLYDQRQKRKILFVLSDGQPNSVTGSDAIVARDLIESVKETERLGIETIGIGICTDAPKDYYPLHAIVENLEELPKVALRELAALLVKGSSKAA